METKYNELQFDILDPFIRWKKRDIIEFMPNSIIKIDLDEEIKCLCGRVIGDQNFAVQCYLFPKEWEDNKIRSWLLSNESRIKISIEKV